MLLKYIYKSHTIQKSIYCKICQQNMCSKKYFHKNYNTAVPPRTLHLGLVFNMLIPQSTNFVVLQE